MGAGSAFSQACDEKYFACGCSGVHYFSKGVLLTAGRGWEIFVAAGRSIPFSENLIKIRKKSVEMQKPLVLGGSDFWKTL